MYVYIDHKFTWKDHIGYIHSKIAKTIGIMYKIKNSLPTDARKTLYYSLTYPYLQYCNVVWGSAAKSHLQLLLLFQKKIIRIISGGRYSQHTGPLFSQHGILKINDIFKLEAVTFIYNQLHYPSVVQLQNISSIHSHSLRTSNMLRPPRPRTEVHKRFVTYTGVLMWNDLPNELKAINNIVTFKQEIKKYLIGRE